MRKEDKKIIKLTTRQILLYLIDFSVFLIEASDKHRIYRKSIHQYRGQRKFDRMKFSQDIYRLKRAKLINIYKEGKEKYIELTNKGIERLKKYSIEDIKIKKPKVWDKKWRIVIFDIPDKRRIARNILREKLKRLSFIQLQESVFISPFDCKKEIDYILSIYNLQPYLKYIIADILEGDTELIKNFLDSGILKPRMIKK